MKKRISIILLTSLLTSGAVFAKPGSGHHNTAFHAEFQPIFRQLQTLDLNATQKQDVRLILQTLQTDTTATGKGDKSRRHNRQAGLEENDIIAMVEKRFEAAQEKRLSYAKAKHAIFQVLNDAQRQQLLAKVLDREIKHQNMRPEPESFELPFALDLLDLEQSQRSELTTLLIQQHAQRQQDAQQLHALRLRERAIIYAPEFDEDTWRTIAEQFEQALVDRKLEQRGHKDALAAMLSDSQLQELKAFSKLRPQPENRGPRYHRN
ncbi:hypothetical protein IT774_15095 [Salinimonas marina]|uniref:Periplasmic heavy metal sensor n=1 Tax=Salinimonas marina TaxID=2785918 RepID=A0A7S9HCQ3_9ALTE|nr:Spy/CpxP family protein refolding chaperone [Salinimonas marina]QPG05405.1 hypothetical protein IT774_15095 [Salinimonas marina]